jgi:predicted nucleic acid-binding protein
MSLVLDGSVTLAWCMEDERTPALIRLLRQVTEKGAMVPAIWRLEVANGLRTAVKRGRIDASERDGHLADFADMDIATDPETDRYAWTTTQRLAERFDLTPYDASYLELAQRLSLPLATLDKALRAAAKGAGVDVVPL